MISAIIPARLTLHGERELRVERIFEASRDRVWRAFTVPEEIAQWWGRGHKLDIEKHELVRGGHWRYVEHAGRETHGFEGRFRVVEPPRRLEATFEWDGMPGHVVITDMILEELEGGRTRLTSTASYFTAEERDGMLKSGMEQGMNESYAALDRLLARG